MQLKAKPKPVLVTCGRCRHFRRDTEGPSYNAYTEGPSYNAYTHEYFMGESDIGCDPDHTFNEVRGTAKIFADRQRVCEDFLG